MNEQPVVEQEPSSVSDLFALPRVTDLLKDSFARLKKYYSRLFPILGALFISSLAFDIANFSSRPETKFIIGVVALAIYLISLVALLRTISDLESNPNDFSGLISRSIAQVVPYIWVSVLVALATFGALVVMIIPGIILAMLLSQAIFIFLVEDIKGMRALIQSWQYVKGRWWDVCMRIVVLLFVVLFVISVTFAVLNMLHIGPQPNVNGGVTPFPGLVLSQLIEAFLLVPFIVSFLYLFYQSLKGTMGPIMEHEEQTARTWVSISLTLGIVMAIIIPIAFTTALAILIGFLKAGGLDTLQHAITASSTMMLFR